MSGPNNSSRTIPFNSLFPLSISFPTNFIKTSKYTLLSFFPLSLLSQFRRYANIYFLIIAVIQSIPILSPLSAFSSWTPLLFVLFISMLREALEDLSKHRSDKESNAKQSKYFNYEQRKFIDTNWGSLKVSDLVLIIENEIIPADVVVLSSSYETGACFIETASLDGEKTLKPRMCPSETAMEFLPENGGQVKGEIFCNPPNALLSQFEGSMKIEDKTVFLGIKQLLLRGSVLKNTKWVIGIVVFTGIDTKIMRNSDNSKLKQSRIEARLNYFLIYILLFELLCCFILGLLCGIWSSLYLTKHEDYINREYSASVEGTLTFFTYFILNSTMIPISLIVTLELVKLAQGYFITVDEQLFSKLRNKFAKVATTSINEELGQIEYIFCDKTGTLTCNEMRFKFCLIGNEVFGDKKNENKEIGENRKNFKENNLNNMEENIFLKKSDPLNKEDYKEWYKSRFNQETEGDRVLLQEKEDEIKLTEDIGFRDNNLIKLLKTSKNDSLYKLFFLSLSTCHECIVVEDKEADVKYQGPSPDEITLVQIASEFGYEFLGLDKNLIKIDIFGVIHTFELLQRFEFTSDRKRMSVIIRENNQIKLIIKGADNVIKQRLDNSIDQPFLEQISFKLDEYSKLGFRTLCIATKEISELEYTEFKTKLDELANVPDRENKIFELAETIENNLFLIGATVVEDRLQDQVASVLKDFLLANIKVWMLTGDKLETAENIAISCSLIQPNFQTIRLLPFSSYEQYKSRLIEIYEIIQLSISLSQSKALLVEGEALAQILSDHILTDIFLDIIEMCETVVCCRTTPKQKAQVVSLVKNLLGKVTLAIGDGANDVNMIQEAHIGVGLFGVEGMRAAQTADFALGEFKLLWKLVLVHGRWCYIRISEMILYFFYKNMLFTIIQSYFAGVCAYSGQSVFDDSYIVFFNLLFTSLPLMIRAISEKDIYYMVFKEKYEKEKSFKYQLKEDHLIKRIYPLLYYVGQKGKLFTSYRYFAWILQGAIHGLIIFLFCFFCFMYNFDGDLWIFSIFLYTCVILVVSIKLAFYTQAWTLVFWGSIFVTSIFFYFAYIWISSEISDLYVYSTSFYLFSSSHYYFVVALAISLVMIFDGIIIFFKQNYKPGTIEKARSAIKLKKFEELEKLIKT